MRRIPPSPAGHQRDDGAPIGSAGGTKVDVDWSATSLGPVAGWSSALRGFADLVRDHASPAALIWGPDLSCLHNPAFAPLLPPDSPQGQACGLLWPGADGIAPMVRAALAGRPGRLAALERPGPHFFDLLAVPLRDLDGRIAGVLLTATDITRPILAERRDAFLLDLDAALRDLDAPEALLRTATEALARHLGTGRCGFAEVDAAEIACTIETDWTDGSLPSARGNWPLARFGAGLATLRAGDPLGLDGSAPEGGLTVPLLKQGRLAALLCLHHPTPPR